MRVFFALIVIAFFWWLYGTMQPHSWDIPVETPLITIPYSEITADPNQKEISGLKWKRGDYDIQALAQYAFTAKVLSVCTYGTNKTDLSPLDFAVCWGDLTQLKDPFKGATTNHGGRFFNFFWIGKRPENLKNVERYIANNHLIPDSKSTYYQLSKIRKGQTIKMNGYLAKVTQANGWRWVSSLTRTDNGAGACELLWVTEVAVVE